jgi:nucleotide-binding universal stress UspA family protein
MKILIGYDGSDCADDAIDDLVRAGLPDTAEAVILTVAEHYAADPHDPLWKAHGPDTTQPELPHRVAELIRQSNRVVDRGILKLKEIFPGWEISGETPGTFPVPAILRKAEEWRPDLIVLGSHGRTRLGRFFLGSVSLEILSHAECPVRIGRNRNAVAASPMRIVVGVDGSAESGRAIDLVISRKWIGGSAARVVGVVDIRQFVPGRELPPTLVDELYASESAERERIRRAVDAACSRLRERGLIAEGEVIDGDPRMILVDDAEEWGADSIVIGARGVSGLKRFVLGSVSYAVAARAHCSVEVARVSIDS